MTVRLVREGDLAILTIARPAVKNALDSATMLALRAHLEALARDEDLRVAILSGEGDTFVSGGDLSELRERASRSHAEELAAQGTAVCDAIADLPVPVIAALDGAAIGGGAELAVACDLRVFGAKGTIAFKHVRLGVTTAWGTLGRLHTLLGARAARLLYTGETLDAQGALALGLADAAAEVAMVEARAIAASIARAAPAAIRQTKLNLL
ncbi:MAG: enoyl-CoA hydratase/isomerase family protein, partial [Polyangiaceae bacterium]|nr:enoyl-CoA hydratase/isomerase family protein [Polyangiaceae bacterium]